MQRFIRLDVPFEDLIVVQIKIANEMVNLVVIFELRNICDNAAKRLFRSKSPVQYIGESDIFCADCRSGSSFPRLCTDM